MFIKRDMESAIRSGAQQVPVIAIIGPRQSGKSTLAKDIFKNHVYLDMQDVDLLEFARTDPKGFLKTYKNDHGIIFDEAQYAPELFPQIRVETDKDPQLGYYVLSGSQNFLLLEQISESLAGRVYFYELLPLSIKELKDAQLLLTGFEDQIFKGFYPRVYQSQIVSQEYYENYISTYVERDIRKVKNIENILVFKKFIRMCALHIGCPLNVADIAGKVGINVATARNWLSLLQTSFILFLLPTYQDNLSKRLTKTPKLFFYDVGLAATMMGANREMLQKNNMLFGALFENMVIVDLKKNFDAHRLKPNLSFYRDSNQNEIDLIIELHGRTTPVEIKTSHSVSSSLFKLPSWFKTEIKSEQSTILVYGGDKDQTRSQGQVVSWTNLDNIIQYF